MCVALAAPAKYGGGDGKAMLRACGILQATSRPTDTQTDNDRDRQKDLDITILYLAMHSYLKEHSPYFPF